MADEPAQDGERPTAARRHTTLVVAGTAAVGAASIASVGVFAGTGLGEFEKFLILLLLQASSYAASGWLSRRFNTPVWSLDAALLIASLVLLDPMGVVASQTAGALIGDLANRRPWRRTVAVISQTAVGAVAAVGVVELIAGHDPASLRFAGAAMLAAVVWVAASELSITPFFMVTAGDSISSTVAALRFSIPRTPFIGALGYMAGLAATVSPVAGLFAVPPMAAMVYVLAEHFRAERDRERAETLFRTAEAAHASIEPGDVVAALTAAASSLLSARSAELRSTPPRDGEIGVSLDLADERWLIVEGAAAADDEGQLLAAIAAVGSSALENARMAEELRHQAVHDSLTGLPNQVLFNDRVAQAVSAAGRTRERFAVVAIDLDAFRKVNDSLGHGAGDQLLRAVGERASEAVRAGDTVARLSGDTFMLLLAGVGTAESAGVITEKILAAIRRPISLQGQDVFMSACAGLAFYPDDGQQPEHLLRNADSALHRAKGHGPGTYQIYAQGMNELAHQRLARESELHQAVRRDELRVRYQPQVDLRTGRIIGVEALVRWEHPTLGLLAPVEFVPLAEESGLIVDVDTWVLKRAARQAAVWLEQGLPPVRVGVNLSARHFQSPERLVGTIRDVLDSTGLPPLLLELEVTEGLAITEDESALVLQRIRDLGVSISIDDFGTGYSMLGRLSRFPVDRLKIDRSFVKEIRSSRDDAPIVSAIIAMARSLKIETVAEGVETLEQQTFLRNRGCDLAQGYLFSHPTEPDEVERMLRTPSVGFNVPAVH